MLVESVAGLTDALRRHRLLESAQLGELDRLQAAFPSSRALAGELLRRGWLTPYQVKQLLQGRERELLLGSYLLLERIGEGGMGEVFKARNWKLGQIVALKLIRKERIDNPDAVRRFQREIRAAAQLDHPNIVRAFDADEVGGAHLLVMEYVQGTDLAKLVKQSGRPAVDKACDYVRQAALGLQHACERGLVHRDIKPHNLLLTPRGVVKVLDMGLARLNRTGDDELSATMTREGAVMGTLDYISPEQAMDSHDVDIRADLYSLGCTLYFLLTGKVPFPSGEAMQKLLRHRLDEPIPVEQLRPDTPPGVAAVVRKLMAKRPEDRYQTPAEVAAALEAAVAAPLSAEATLPAEGLPAAPARDAAEHTAADGQTDAVLRWADERRRARQAQGWRGSAVYALGGLLFLGLAGLFVVLLLHFGLPTPRHTVPPAPPFDQLPVEQQVSAVAEELRKLNPGFDGVVEPMIINDEITRLEFVTDDVTDLSPVRTLTLLKQLNCHGSGRQKGRLWDLAPLKGMRLRQLYCWNNSVSDLSPLKGMKLEDLGCDGNPVSDLSPLKGMPLYVLYCDDTHISDLAPLEGMPLTQLSCRNTKVSNLSPLRDMKLTNMSCAGTPVSDLSPLKDMKLTYLSCADTHVSDLSPLKDMKLTYLSCADTHVSDLSPLRGMPLYELICDFDPKRDAEILRSIPTLGKINGKPASEFWKTVGDAPPGP